MESLFIDLNTLNVTILFLVGFVGGLVSGFIGSGGAFVLTPAMMTLGVPGLVAVASNICHKFPKALVGALKRHKYGQVDWKLGIAMGIFAEGGMLVGKHIMVDIRSVFGNAGTDLYVSIIFVINGIFRYLKLALVDGATASPTLIVLKDRFIQLTIICWLVLMSYLLYGNR